METRMTNDNTPTTSETILASANGETDPKALSNAAVTEAPVTAAPPSNDADLATRVAALEADIAFLRQMFGWPKK